MANQCVHWLRFLRIYTFLLAEDAFKQVVHPLWLAVWRT